MNTLARLARGHGIAAEAKRRSRCTTDSSPSRPVAEGVASREFEPEAVDQLRTADITHVAAGEGWLYLAAVEDLYPRQIVGRSMGERIDSRPVVDAPEMALARRRPGEGPAAYPDRGSRHASEHYQHPPAGRGIIRSMGRRGSCRENAPMGSFFARLEKELTRGESFATRAGARASLFEYIGVFCNTVRRHSSLGYRSPVDYERVG